MTWTEDAADEEWVEDDASGDDLLECPNCGAPVHEDTQQCPHCRDWITPVDRGDRGKRLIWIIAAVLLILSLSGLFMMLWRR